MQQWACVPLSCRLALVNRAQWPWAVQGMEKRLYRQSRPRQPCIRHSSMAPCPGGARFDAFASCPFNLAILPSKVFHSGHSPHAGLFSYSFSILPSLPFALLSFLSLSLLSLPPSSSLLLYLPPLSPLSFLSFPFSPLSSSSKLPPPPLPPPSSLSILLSRWRVDSRATSRFGVRPCAVA